MAINSPVRIPSPWANGNTLTTIPATTSDRGVASWDQGFPVETSITLAEGGVPPRYIDFNTILNNLTQYAVWMQSGGQATWANNLDYPVNALVWGSNGKMYKSVQSNGVSSTVKNPVSDTNGTYWIPWTAESLPLAGGTMSGTISAGTSTVIRRNSDQASVDFFGDTSTDGKGTYFSLRGCSRGTEKGFFIIRAGDGTYARTFQGEPDGTLTWGGQPMSVTSDERKKQDITPFDEKILTAWGEVCWTSFRFQDAVERKGTDARIHAGVIAQRVISVFSERGLDATKLGILCYDESEDLWTVRYEEALALEAVYQRYRADKLEERLAAIEAKLNA